MNTICIMQWLKLMNRWGTLYIVFLKMNLIKGVIRVFSFMIGPYFTSDSCTNYILLLSPNLYRIIREICYEIDVSIQQHQFLSKFRMTGMPLLSDKLAKFLDILVTWIYFTFLVQYQYFFLCVLIVRPFQWNLVVLTATW